MICIMHESENYGFLEINSRKISEKSLASMCGIALRKCTKLLQELEENAVYSRDERGVIYSRRMLKDQRLIEVRRTSGTMGGNPNLVKQKVKQNPENLVNQTSNQNPTPSSAYASSTSVYPLPPAGIQQPEPIIFPEFPDEETGPDLPTQTRDLMQELKDRINDAYSSWKKRPHFTRAEMEILHANAHSLADITADDWVLLRAYLRCEIPPEWGKFWQPDGRGKFMETISDVLSNADRWRAKCRKEKIETGIEPQPKKTSA